MEAKAEMISEWPRRESRTDPYIEEMRLQVERMRLEARMQMEAAREELRRRYKQIRGTEYTRTAANAKGN